MACEDYPCCGHESNCCPDFDDNGNQLNMKCTCGATVPLGGSSLCDSCLYPPFGSPVVGNYEEDFYDEDDDCWDDWDECNEIQRKEKFFGC